MMSNKPFQQVGTSLRSRQMDSLAKDARAAREAGMSYGMWKAKHPKTKQDSEAPTAPKLPKEEKRPAEKTKKQPQIYTVTCQCCGTVFETTNKQKKYCRPKCNRIMQQTKYRERHKNNQSDADANEREPSYAEVD